MFDFTRMCVMVLMVYCPSSSRFVPQSLLSAYSHPPLSFCSDAANLSVEIL